MPNIVLKKAADYGHRRLIKNITTGRLVYVYVRMLYAVLYVVTNQLNSVKLHVATRLNQDHSSVNRKSTPFLQLLNGGLEFGVSNEFRGPSNHSVRCVQQAVSVAVAMS